MIKELKNTYIGRGEIKGYTLTKLAESEKGFIYEKKSNETGKLSYEVFKRKVNKQFNCISYPSSKSFGVWAWECSTLKRAEEIFFKF